MKVSDGRTITKEEADKMNLYVPSGGELSGNKFWKLEGPTGKESLFCYELQDGGNILRHEVRD